MKKAKSKKTELADLAEELLGSLRASALVKAEQPADLLQAHRTFPIVELISPGDTARFVAAAANSEFGALAAVSPALAALSVVSEDIAAFATKNPDLAKLAVLSPGAAELAAGLPSLRAIAGESSAHAILAARAMKESGTKTKVKRKVSRGKKGAD
jgi:hypothetical protein